ncbi:MAG: hypothetical protein K0Q61_3796 [Rhodococcus erythropolis]|nr:hypothetical protein [Rhodococcus erythropolis]
MAGNIEFRNDDSGYLAWLAEHPDGFVINIPRKYTPTYARVHHAGCRTISGRPARGGTWTGPYVKVCSERFAELQQWAIGAVGQSVAACGICCPAGGIPQVDSTQHFASLGSDRDGPVKSGFDIRPEAVTASLPERRSVANGPSSGCSVVEVWADDYIRFDRLPEWQVRLRNEIRNRSDRLTPSGDQVLEASFFGPKLPNADVENLVLYNIGSFRTAGRNGIRFEHGSAVPPAPDGTDYPFCYRYSLAPRSSSFAHWQRGRTLASFEWADLGAFSGEKKLAQVWFALSRAEAEVATVARLPDTTFAVRVQVRPPQGVRPVWGGLVKGIFDGVITAFQSHSDTTSLADVAKRISTIISVDTTAVEQYLLDERRAVLGVVPKLASAYRDGVKWDPSDHCCVAGELLAAAPVGRTWAIKGEVIEVSRPDVICG